MPSRRVFLRRLAFAAAALGGASGLGGALFHGGRLLPAALAGQRDDGMIRLAPRAGYWTSVALAGENCLACHAPREKVAGRRHNHEPQIVKCLLCARGCLVREGRRGECGIRMNVGGELRSLSYGRPVAVHVDPIEKKPFYHFLPGAAAFSLGTAGCPLHCRFCQNWELSQALPEHHPASFAPPRRICQEAASRRAPVIAFTYNEPTVFAEYALDIAREARATGIRSVMVSCGYMNEAPLADLCAALDAIKIDLKGFDEAFYREVCGGELRPVLRTIRQIARSRCHLEIVNLVVPTLNDGEAMIAGLVDWILGEAGPDVPLHFSRFQPDYRLRNLPPTPVSTLERARALALNRGMRHVYVGNVPGHPGNDTVCPSCARTVIRRTGFLLREMRLRNGRCPFCGRCIAGVWT